MTFEAKKTEKRFLFAGVYQYSNHKDLILNRFIESGCDIIMPSVNELPLVIEKLRLFKK